jgi:hypothetical protein
MFTSPRIYRFFLAWILLFLGVMTGSNSHNQNPDSKKE